METENSTFCPFRRQTFVVIASDKVDFREIENMAKKLNTDSPCLYKKCQMWSHYFGRCGLVRRP